jgi:2-polyprenyl-3-methyl-5-hydroxy-6-metoxy-1,4-benzoquinol methylase
MSDPTARSASSGYVATDGAAYEIFLGRWTRRLAEALVDFAQFPADGDLLDAGCGTGALAAAMAARGRQRRVLGIDIAALISPSLKPARRGLI